MDDLNIKNVFDELAQLSIEEQKLKKLIQSTNIIPEFKLPVQSKIHYEKSLKDNFTKIQIFGNMQKCIFSNNIKLYGYWGDPRVIETTHTLADNNMLMCVQELIKTKQKLQIKIITHSDDYQIFEQKTFEDCRALYFSVRENQYCNELIYSEAEKIVIGYKCKYVHFENKTRTELFGPNCPKCGRHDFALYNKCEKCGIV